MKRTTAILLPSDNKKVSILQFVGAQYAGEKEINDLNLRANSFLRMLSDGSFTRKLCGNPPLSSDEIIPSCPDQRTYGNIWDDIINELFNNSTSKSKLRAVRILIKFFEWECKEDDLQKLLTIDYQDVTDALVEHFKNNESSKETLNKTISNLRQFFMVIGRKHSFNDGQDLLDMRQKTIGCSGNPVTDSVKETIKKNIKNGGNKTKDTHDDKKGLPVSLPLAYHAFLFMIKKSLDNVLTGTGTDTRRMINPLLTSFLLLCCIHDVSRPIEVYGHLFHENLYTYESIQTKNNNEYISKRYLLALAFVKPETLVFLIQNDLLPHDYIHESWKGKSLNERLNRVKRSFTPDANGLDLVFWYAVLTRLVMIIKQLSGNTIQQSIIHHKSIFYRHKNDKDEEKEDTSWLQYLNTYFNNKVGVSGFTFYSLRYGHAEEMLKCNIKEDIRRKLMGHSDKSQMNLSYAQNKEGRPFVLKSRLISE